MADIRLSTFVHEFQCPHCQQRMRHTSPGGTILFANLKCEHCGHALVIVQDKLWVLDQGSKSEPT